MRAWQLWVAVNAQHQPSLFSQRLVESEAEIVAERLRREGCIVEVREVLVQEGEKR